MIGKLFNKKNNTADKPYRIKGSLSEIEILLPPDHKLDFYQNMYKNYDRKLVAICKTVFEKTRGTCVDIGANIGDTAAGIRASTLMPLICIEGDPGFFSYLEKNTKQLMAITRVNAFVSGEKEIRNASLVRKEGSGRIRESGTGGEKVSFLTLPEILGSIHVQLNDISLIKIDTDGFDFGIILGNAKFISEHKPSLFFEYEVNSPASHAQSLEVVRMLSGEGYRFIVYDNYGNFFSSITSDFQERFTELNAYIKSGLENGGGICYTDIFAVHDESLFNDVLRNELKTY
ncbi:MAG: FkbM family methyltransferase [Bacteroidia bacterium]